MNLRSFVPLAFALTLTLALTLAACSGDDGDTFEAVPFETTHVLDAEALASLTEAADDGTLVFSGQPAALEGLAPWRVIVAPGSDVAPAGLLRLVTEVEQRDGQLRVKTVQAPLQLAFRKLHVALARRTVGLDGQDLGLKGQDLGLEPTVAKREQALTFSDELTKLKTLDEYPFNGDDDVQTEDDQVHVTGSLSGGFAYVFTLDVDWGAVTAIPDKVIDCVKEALKLSFGGCKPEQFLPEVKVGFSVEGGADAELDMKGVAFVGYKQEDEVLASKGLTPFTVGGLLTFRPRVEIVGGFSGGAQSEFHLSTAAHARLGTGISFSSQSGGSFSPPDYEDAFSAPSVDVTLSAESKVRVGPRFHLRLYDVMGPYAALFVGAELSANRERDPCWQLFGTADLQYGFEISLKDLPGVGTIELAEIHDEKSLGRKEIASGGCKPLAGGGAAPSVAGAPDPATFAEPTFAPWARAYADVVLGHPYEGPGAQLEWASLTPTVDGRLLIAGSDARALLKIDPDGQLVWARRYLAEGIDPSFWTDTLVADLLPGRIVDTGDARMLLIAHPYALLKLDAAGKVLWAERFEVPYRESWLRLVDAVADGQGGAYLVGTYGEDKSEALAGADVWVLRIDAAGQVVWSTRIGEAGWGEVPRALVAVPGATGGTVDGVPIDGVLVVGSRHQEAGQRWQGLALRLGDDGALRWAKTLVARPCDPPGADEQRLHLTRAIATSDGDLVVAGQVEGAGYRLAVAKLKEQDGALGWSATSGPEAPAAGLGPWLTDLVELPTSGYLAAGVHVGAPKNKRELLLAGLDGVGRALWARTYGAKVDPQGSGGQGAPRDEGYPALVLTRDGGAVVAGYTNSLAGSEASPSEHNLWALKVPAKDGAITFGAGTPTSGGGAQSTVLSLVDGQSCLEAAAWSPPAKSQAAAPVALQVKVESPTVTTRALTD